MDKGKKFVMYVSVCMYVRRDHEEEVLAIFVYNQCMVSLFWFITYVISLFKRERKG